MRELRTEIEINASTESVWKTLVDFDAYPEWNPFIRRIDGRPELDMRLKVSIQPSGSRAMTFKPTIIRLEPERELRWIGSLFVRGLFDGEHIFIIERLSEDKVKFVQGEKFSGVLVPLMWRSLNTNTRRGFNEMNLALKERAERAHSGRVAAN